MNRRRRTRTVRWLFAIVAGATVAAGTPAAVVAAPAPADVAVIVQAGDADRAAAEVERFGGTVDQPLPVIGAVAARVDAADIAALDARPGVDVALDEELELTGADFAVAEVDPQLAAVNPGPTWSPASGTGVGVAVIDTGVSEVADLAGRLVHGPDLSGEGHTSDSYGHGTFMAGLIAGDGSASAGPVRHMGVAPGAHVVSVKVAGRDGATSLSRVLEAIGWVVSNQEEHNIRVLNLSFGVISPRAWAADPLSAAVEAAWASGITVVVASGNEGTGTVTSPGRDPWVITVGALDVNGTVDPADDSIPGWSGSGKVTGINKPEVVAPGVSVVSLRAPGSVVDETNPDARVEDAYLRGSGTSMAAAVVSGAAAALTELHPKATPDDIKGALVAGGRAVAGTTARSIDLAAADTAQAQPGWWQRHPIAFDRLDGQLANGMPWSGLRWSDEHWSGLRWSGLRWSGASWSGLRWSADESWAGMRWSGLRWSDEHWSGLRWSGLRWSGMRWSGLRWSEDTWAGMRWSGLRWSGVRWSEDAWAGARWSGAGWSASEWGM